MNDNQNSLEQEIARISLPRASASLDDRVMRSLQAIRSTHSSDRVDHRISLPRRERSWIRYAVQTIAVCLLCLASYAAGGGFESRDRSQARPVEATNTSNEAKVIEVPIEPSLLPAFQSLVLNSKSTETIWGSSDTLIVNHESNIQPKQ